MVDKWSYIGLEIRYESVCGNPRFSRWDGGLDPHIWPWRDQAIKTYFTPRYQT